MKTEMKYLDIIMKELCKRVGANFDEIDFKEPNWFYKYEWTEQQEKEFEKWMIKYLFQNKAARNEIMERPIKFKPSIKKVVTWFIFNYGWKLKENKEEKKDESKQ